MLSQGQCLSDILDTCCRGGLLCELTKCLCTFELHTGLWICLWIVKKTLILSDITASGDLPEEEWEEREERRCWEVGTVGKNVVNSGGECIWTSVMLLSSVGWTWNKKIQHVLEVITTIKSKLFFKVTSLLKCHFNTSNSTEDATWTLCQTFHLDVLKMTLTPSSQVNCHLYLYRYYS